MAMVTEFVTAINQICAERGIDAEKVFEALEEAVLAAYLKENEKEEEGYSAEMDRETGEFRIISRKEVVKKVEDADTQISLDDALKMNDALEIGDSIELEQEIEDFGRIAAQTAKQVILQKVREAEKDAVLAEYSNRVGEVFQALMQSMKNGQAVFEIGKATAFMPQEEQISNEFYRIGERYKVLLKSIEDTARGETLIVSRAAPEFLAALFEIEVPEIESGIVEIKAIAREGGSRSKMAVVSHQDGVDPIGSCVGQRGTRIANVMSELGEEKIDIIEWRDDPAEFVEKALSPAQVISVKISNGVAVVKVEEDQLSLAIGREGQNVRLAAKLTGFKIDIQGPSGKTLAETSETEGESTDEEVTVEMAGETREETVEIAKEEATVEVAETETAETEVETEAELDAKLVAKLEKAGKTAEEVKGLTVAELMELEGIGKATAEKIFEALNN